MVLFRSHEGRWNAYREAARAGLGARPYYWIAVAVLGAVALYYLSIPVIGGHYTKVCSKGEYGPPDQCSYWDTVSAIVFMCLIFADDHGGGIAALATVALVCFTFTLWRSTHQLWESGEKQHGLAREEFIASHRPLLKVRAIFIFFGVGSLDARITFKIRNAGSSDALNIAINYFIIGQTKDSAVLPTITDSRIAPPTLKPGEDFTQTGVGSEDLGKFLAASHNMLLAGKDDRSLNVRVTVTYDDLLGNGRQTSVERRYDMTERRLRPVEGSEFEYED